MAAVFTAIERLGKNIGHKKEVGSKGRAIV